MAIASELVFEQFGDPVHKAFALGPICSLSAHTAPVQRLKKLKQLGPTHYGRYCSALHTRFEHSLGVAHLARGCVQHLAAAGSEGVSELDIELTSLAGNKGVWVEVDRAAAGRDGWGSEACLCHGKR